MISRTKTAVWYDFYISVWDMTVCVWGLWPLIPGHHWSQLSSQLRSPQSSVGFPTVHTSIMDTSHLHHKLDQLNLTQLNLMLLNHCYKQMFEGINFIFCCFKFIKSFLLWPQDDWRLRQTNSTVDHVTRGSQCPPFISICNIKHSSLVCPVTRDL